MSDANVCTVDEKHLKMNENWINQITINHERSKTKEPKLM